MHLCEFKAGLVCVVKSRITRARLRDSVSKKKNKSINVLAEDMGWIPRTHKIAYQPPTPGDPVPSSGLLGCQLHTVYYIH